MYTPGIHTSLKYLNMQTAMVYKKEEKKAKQMEKYGQKCIDKATCIHSQQQQRFKI